jgi:hypothetical protein
MHVAQSERGGRGVELLLAHCASAGNMGDDHRSPARERLCDAVGDDLARLLVNALVPRGPRPHRASP